MRSSFSHTDCISLADFSQDAIWTILNLARDIKRRPRKYHSHLSDKTLAMIFQKASTRTRVSFEVGMFQLGGKALFLSNNDMQLNRGESISDTAQVLSRFCDGIMIRTFDHTDVIDLAEHATIPVINGLTDLLHPCQILADLQTIYEHHGTLQNQKIVYIGDGNNVAHSWINAAGRLGLSLTLCVPENYDPDTKILESARLSCQQSGGTITLTRNPMEAAENADVLYTDVWVSMGQDDERTRRLHDLAAYQINTALLEKAHSDVLVMHCLPAHRGEEITAEVIDGPHSVVFDEAENRLHAQKALLVLLMK